MIQLSKPNLTEDDIARAVKVLRSGKLVQGQNVAEFERKLEAFTELPNAVAVSSGTAALHLAIKVFGIGPGDTVIVPAFTFPATANVVEAVGAESAFCDVDPLTYVVSPETIAARVAHLQGKRLRAVIVVHEFGYPARIAEISRICRRNSLVLIEDAACALGTIADGKHPGYYGDAACLSFHPRKAITTGEGGAVLTSCEEVAEKITALRNHGIVHSDTGMDFRDAGLNYRLTDFQAALALGQLDRFPDELLRRRVLAEVYRKHLSDIGGLTLPEIPDGHSLQSFMVTLAASVSRNQLITTLLDNGIQTNLGAQALNCLIYFKRKYGLHEDSCPVASRLYHSGLVLPLYGVLTETEIDRVCRNISESLWRTHDVEGEDWAPR